MAELGILTYYRGSVFDTCRKHENAFLTYTLDKQNKLPFIVKVLWKLCIAPISINLGYSKTWTSKVKKINHWLISDSNQNQECIAKYIKKRNPKACIYYYAMDMASGMERKKYCDFPVSWDPHHAEKFKGSFIPLFYDKILLPPAPIKYDYMWIGMQKPERDDCMIASLHKELISVCDGREGIWLTIKSGEKGIDYKTQYLSILNQSRVIVEFVRNDQAGLTLRSLEALFYGKKLITNNLYIKNYDFYKKDNIFIYGEDKELKIWLEKPYSEVEEEIKQEYTFESFCQKFVSLGITLSE